MRTKLNTPPPRVVWDDEWEGPRPSERRITLVGALLWIGVLASCVAFLTRLDKLWEPDGDSAWVASASEPSVVVPKEAPPAPTRPQPTRPIAPRPAVRRVAPATEPPTGFISVNSTPWAELSVDGRVVGTTPQIKLRVRPGRHHLVLVRAGFQTQTTWVTVVAGGSVRVTDITLPAITP